MADETHKQLFDRVAAGQWDGVSPRPSIDTRLDAMKAYDALHLVDPDRYPQRRGWRRRVWAVIAAVRR
jgi:hypothetical protein